jgi:hypothetical protein
MSLKIRVHNVRDVEVFRDDSGTVVYFWDNSMLFAPKELYPFSWWAIVSERLWKERIERELQDDFEEWRAEMLARPGLLSAYRRYKELTSLLPK